MTIDKHSWGYRRDAALHDFKTVEEVIANMAQTVSCGGNILINVGPTSDGRIIPLFEERLLQWGEWLKVNGEAIYESKPWTHQNDTVTSDVWYTQRGGNVYGIVLQYPRHGDHIELGAIEGAKVKSVHLLGHDSQEIKWEKNAAGHVVLHFPHLNSYSHVKYAYVFRFEFK